MAVSINAGIQSQGCEAAWKIILFIIMQLPSLALDSGIHARMTGLKIVTTDKEYVLERMDKDLILLWLHLSWPHLSTIVSFIICKL